MLIDWMNKRLRGGLTKRLAQLGLRVQKLDEGGRRYLLSSYDTSRALPPGAAETLRSDAAGLTDLRRQYEQLNLPATLHSQWNARQLQENLALPWFRGDNVYVWQYRQLRSEARLRQYLALLDVQSTDKMHLLERLEEDGLFGCWLFDYTSHKSISRDLLDSVNEINFLEENLHLSAHSSVRILDIGAGYGRLAHRMCSALKNVAAYDCVDAVPESTFLCDYYLNFRGLPDRARSVPLHQHDQLHNRYDLAVNIHSFSECTRAAIRWWLEQVAKREIPWLLIVPNEPELLLTTERDGSKQDFLPDIEAAGYRLRVKRPVYAQDELRDLIGVKDHFFLFQRAEKADSC